MGRIGSFVLSGLLFASCATHSEFKHAMTSIEARNPFPYPLDVRYEMGTNQNILLCNHGFSGSSWSVVAQVKPYTSDTVIGFNYFDHDFTHETGDDRKTTMATPLEVMPLIYMLKALAVENKLPAVSLYGYALGAATILHGRRSCHPKAA